MTISPYQTDIIRPNYKPFKNNLELISKVLDYKQKTFDSNYKSLQSLKQQALNIDFLNKDRQGQINDYNKRINDHFTKFNDLGDLSNSKVLTGHMDIFNELSGRTDLINDYKHDRRIRTEMSEVQKKANSKNPLKEGFHQMNWEVYRHGVEEYVNSTGELPNVDKYVNYIDYNKGAREVALDVAEEEITRFHNDGKGNLIEVTTKQRDPEKVKRAISTYLGTHAQGQLGIEAKWKHLRNKNDISYVTQLLNDSQEQLITQKENLQSQIKQLGNDLTPENLSTKEALQGEIIKIDKQLHQALEDIDDDTLVSRLSSLHSNNVLGQLTNAFSYKNVSEKLKLDPVWAKVETLKREDKRIGISLANLDLAQQKFELDKQEFGLKKVKALAELGLNSDGSPVVQNQGITIPIQEDAKKAEKIIDKTIDKAFSFKAAQKDIMALGLSNADLNQDNLGNLRFQIKALENSILKFSGPQIAKSTERDIKLAQDKKQLIKLRSQLASASQTRNRPKEVWINDLIEDISFYDNVENPAGSLYIEAVKEAINKLRINDQPVTVQSVENTVNELLIDPKSSSFELKQSIERYTEGMEAVMVESGAINLEGEDARKALKDYLTKEDVITQKELSQSNLDLDALSSTVTKATQKRINDTYKNYIVSELVWSNNMGEIKGHEPLNPRQLGNDIFTHVAQENPNASGYKIFTLKEDYFKDEDGEFNRKFYTLGKDGEYRMVTKDNPFVIVGDLDSEKEIFENLSSRFRTVTKNKGLRDEVIAGVNVRAGKTSNGIVTVKLNDPNIPPIEFTYKPNVGKIIMSSPGKSDKVFPIPPGSTDRTFRNWLNQKLNARPQNTR